jgi:3-oxoacyl-[acyl-carrier-protein] synthase III
MGTRYCQSLYPTRQAYSDRVIAAADDLIARRLLLPEDRGAIIVAAEAQADLYPKCVPPRN